MTPQDTLAALEQMGTAQNRNIYRRHGVAGDQFGVSMAGLNTLRKQIKTDHTLAQHLWATGNHDARMLATMIADPKQADDALLDAWAAERIGTVEVDHGETGCKTPDAASYITKARAHRRKKESA